MSGAIGIFSRPAREAARSGRVRVRQSKTRTIFPPDSRARGRTLAISGSARAFTQRRLLHRARLHPRHRRHARQRRFVTGDMHIDHYTSLGNLFFKTSILAEERQNGTVTHAQFHRARHRSLRYAREFTNDSFSAAGLPHPRGLSQLRSTASRTDRNTDRLAYTQTVPSQARRRRGAVAASRGAVEPAGRRRRVSHRGTDTDHLVPSGLRVAGGTQLQHGVYGQADVTFGRAPPLRRGAPQLRRRQPVPQPQRRLRRRQEAAARPRQHLSQFSRSYAQ